MFRVHILICSSKYIQLFVCSGCCARRAGVSYPARVDRAETSASDFKARARSQVKKDYLAINLGTAVHNRKTQSTSSRRIYTRHTYTNAHSHSCVWGVGEGLADKRDTERQLQLVSILPTVAHSRKTRTGPILLLSYGSL